ncbi:MAG: tail fiber domain-containing protein [Cyanobacteria bacterium SIG26]|nr:tail fiber domain-containing protein [Cyanobacteria bacterium SIG26]
MKYNKYNAFTMAEVMILLLTVSVLMAAFAPVMTKRRVNVSKDDVWSFVTADEERNAYFDNAIDRSEPAQAFIGITPKVEDVHTDAVNNLYSKLVIRATDSLKNNDRQNHISFRYRDGNERGQKVASLFAGNQNLLLGSDYKKLELDKVSDIASSTYVPEKAYANTAYGVGALNKLTKGQYNTALGTNALSELTKESGNTAVGVDAGKSLTIANNNTLVGFQAGFKIKGEADADGKRAEENVYIGSKTGYAESKASKNTAVGAAALYAITEGNFNTAVGKDTLRNLTKGSSNTAVGYSSMINLSSGRYNTSIGSNACNLLQGSAANKTCIGSGSGTGGNPLLPLFKDDVVERVYIGSKPKNTGAGGPMAVLEVHNVPNYNYNSKPIGGNMGNESVVINGNLIVRGQTYLETPIYRQSTVERIVRDNYRVPKGLVAYTMMTSAGKTIFVGLDGAKRTNITMIDGGLDYNIVRENCICTHSFVQDADQPTFPNSVNTSYTYNTNNGASKSYDWTSKTGIGGIYKDESTGVNVTLVNQPDFNGLPSVFGNIDEDSYGRLEIDYNRAHYNGVTSCCPDLTSDSRLKNIGEKYSGGLDELKRLNIYNYTFKKDKNKTPHVGVIAQDLKLVFPKAVIKDKKGYYHIRWDEMFYALINSVKTIHARVEKLSVKIANDTQRMNALKSSNKKLNAKLDELDRELSGLE